MTIIESHTCVTCGQAVRPIRHCVICGATLPPKARTDAKHCSHACRQKAHRRRHPKHAKQAAATRFSDNLAAAGIPEADHNAVRVAALFERLKNGKTRTKRRNAKRRLIAIGIDPHANGERT